MTIGGSHASERKQETWNRERRNNLRERERKQSAQRKSKQDRKQNTRENGFRHCNEGKSPDNRWTEIGCPHRHNTIAVSQMDHCIRRIHPHHLAGTQFSSNLGNDLPCTCVLIFQITSVPLRRRRQTAKDKQEKQGWDEKRWEYGKKKKRKFHIKEHKGRARKSRGINGRKAKECNQSFIHFVYTTEQSRKWKGKNSSWLTSTWLRRQCTSAPWSS